MLDLFRAVILQVPFLDPLTAMLDPSIPLTVSERSEWGDPIHNKDDFLALSKIAPYDTIPEKECIKTSILITAGKDDQRVSLWHSLKYLARLQSRPQNKKCHHFLKIYQNQGHLYSGIESNDEFSFEIAFILYELGIIN